jgi:Xaa-Pro dipeptidase
MELFAAHLGVVEERCSRALAATGFAGLLVHSGAPPLAFADDQSYPFRTNPPFKLWVPLRDAEDCFVYYEPGRRPRLIFHKSEDFWHKPASLPDAAWVGLFDVCSVASRSEARRALPASLQGVAFLGAPFAELSAWGIGATNPAALVHRLDHARARKTDYETACLGEANRIGARGHLAARAAFDAGESEYGIHAAFLQACAQRESELPYNAIVALDSNGATLHYQFLERARPARPHSLLIDAGADFNGYGSDITRTWAAPGADADGFRELVAGMERAQLALCGSVRAGRDWKDVHLESVHAVAGVLVDGGLIRASAAAAVESGAASVFFPHGIGHLLGLQVHDVGGRLADDTGSGTEIPPPAGHAALRLTRRLERGFIVTMEPGLYFIDALLAAAHSQPAGRLINWERVDALRPFGGIRIEDDLLVTDDGSVNLTRNAFAVATGGPSTASA